MDQDLSDAIRQQVMERLSIDLGGEAQVDSPSASDVPAPSKSSSNGDNIILVICCLFVFVASLLGCGYLYWTNRPAGPIHAQPLLVTMTELNGAVDSRIRSCTDEMTRKLEQVSNQVDQLSQRQWLLGVCNNENTSITDPERKKGYLIFDKEWHLNKMPEHLKLTDQERQDLLKAVRTP